MQESNQNVLTDHKGVPVAGFELTSVPARGLHPSFAEISCPDTIGGFAGELWKSEVMPSVLAADEERPKADIPSMIQVVDRIGVEVQNRLRTVLDNRKQGSDGPEALERLRRQEHPFDDCSKLVHGAFAGISKAIEHFSRDITRHSVAILRSFSHELRSTAESFAFERPVAMSEGADRLERLCRFTESVMNSQDVVPPLAREKVLAGLNALNFNLTVDSAAVTIDDMLRDKVGTVRRSCLDNADMIDNRIRHRVGRLEAIGNQLDQKVASAMNLSGRRRPAQTIFLPEVSSSALFDRLASKLKVSHVSDIGEALVKRLEAALNQKAIENDWIADRLPIEELLRCIDACEVVDLYDTLLRSLLIDERSVLSMIAADVDVYATQLADRAMPTMQFADRDSQRFGIESTLTAYLLIPEGDTPFDQRTRKRFVSLLEKSFPRVEVSFRRTDSIMLLVCLSPFVPGSQQGLLTAVDAYLEAGQEQHPGLYGDTFADVPSYEEVRRYRESH